MLAALHGAWAAEVKATVAEGFNGILSVDIPLPPDLPAHAVLLGVQVGCSSCLHLSADNGFPKPAPAVRPDAVPVRWDVDTKGRKSAISTDVTWSISTADGTPVLAKPARVVVEIRPWIAFPKPLIQVVDAKVGQEQAVSLDGKLTEPASGTVRASVVKGEGQTKRVHVEPSGGGVQAGFAFRAEHNGLYMVELRVADDVRWHSESFIFSVTDEAVDQPTLALGASMVGETVETPIKLFDGVVVQSVRSDLDGFVVDSFAPGARSILLKARVATPGNHKGALRIMSTKGETILPFTLVGIKP